MAEIDDASGEGLPDWVRDPAGVLRRRWQVLLAVLLVGLAATGIVASLRRPTYVAKAGVLLATQELSDALVKPTTESTPVNAVDTLAAAALSPGNLRKLIDELGLYPDLRKSKSPEELVALLRDSIEVDPKEPGQVRLPPVMKLAEHSRVMHITFESTDPAEAAAVANRLAMLFETEGLRMRAEQTRRVSEFMKHEVATAEAALREQKGRMAEFEAKHRGELPDDLVANKARIDRLQDQRAQLATDAAGAETRLAQMVTSPTSSAGSPEAKLSEARVALAAARAVDTESHPDVIALRRQIAALEHEIGAAGSGSVGAAARREVAQYQQRMRALDTEIDVLQGKIARAPALEGEQSALERQASGLEGGYSSALQKLEEAQLAENLELSQQGAQVAVVEHAAPPSTPEKGRMKLVLAGAILSAGLAVLAALALELRDPVIATAKGVEALAGVPVLGVMPRVS